MVRMSILSTHFLSGQLHNFKISFVLAAHCKRFSRCQVLSIIDGG